MLKHLFYSVCAFEKNDEWKRNIDELSPHLHKFDGRKLVVIRTGPGIVPASTVEAYFPGKAAFVHIPNNPHNGEVAGFIDQLSTFHPVTDDEALFYAHTKGVRYLCEPHKMLPVWRWRQTMLKECLTDVAAVDTILKTKACLGTYFFGQEEWEEKKKKELFPPLPKKQSARPPLPWHYSGTFWWVNLKTLFSKPNWQKIGHDRFGVENYLCRHITQDEAARVGPPRGVLYEMLWPYTCKTCGTRFLRVTSNSSPAKPRCRVCKTPSEPDACAYSKNVAASYLYSPVSDLTAISDSNTEEPPALRAFTKTPG